ncbi:hypothetical protein AMAG_02485 [Allomyces macrogynus ATCC 38327]|uniref:Uncharacterized protein n=1 Tax=Allomyces macrogynus (strain ATCC 38327) TaxID=578462 RepID=A0A0L0S2C6_ALLM3|nr:hypothetical protein AMAG_02485 [Allomyces macrogynus ATCC 38327]|eukprot:KNE56703.1 hypothetical protein AMAG_02485 [Allomyces macrogynus ATCC 38327]
MKLTALFVVAAATASGLVTADAMPASEDAFYDDDVAASMVDAPVLTATRPPVVRNNAPVTVGEFSPSTLALLAKMSPLQRQAMVQQMRQMRQQRQNEQQMQQMRQQRQIEQHLRAQCRQLAKEDRLAGLSPPSRGTSGAGALASTRANPMDFDFMNRQFRDALARRPAPRGAPQS